ncbi:MAG: tRNA-queuosine alpha-mannosyltransferase domain-containing protein [Phycisphaerae bacterium]
MKILALEPYHGGSHRAFLSGWCSNSRHEWTVLGLPAYKWKWRMRHAAITFADQAGQLLKSGSSWDLIYCSDMLNLAEFLGLLPVEMRHLPTLVYFHENQLTYPVRFETDRDFHYVLSNVVTALAAKRVWFNSAYHRDSFLEGLPAFLKRMPDYQPLDVPDRIRSKSDVRPQGVQEFPKRGERMPGPIRILWAARWEHDKNPDAFFLALKSLKLGGVDFRVSVIGEQFRERPPIFDWARQYFFHHIDRWGFQESRQDYEEALMEADVFVSTANHEFFGITAVEAIAAGAYPLLPKRLAYPEILDPKVAGDVSCFFYEREADGLAERLRELAERLSKGDLWQGDADRAKRATARFSWSKLAPILDEAIESV